MTDFDLAPVFSKAAADKKEKLKRPPPVCIRLNFEERARLEREAGDMTLSAYIRKQLFGAPDPHQYSRRPKRKRREPSLNDAKLAKVLGALGHSSLSQNMNQIAKAAHIGALPVTPELEKDLFEACAAIQEVRRDLMAALGVKPQ